MIPDAVIAHASTGRWRIKIPSQKGKVGELKSYGDRFAACPGVLSIEVNPSTGSILLLHQTTVREISEYARSKDLFSLQEHQVPKAPSADMRRSLGESFKRVDRRIQTLTTGEWNWSGWASAGTRRLRSVGRGMGWQRVAVAGGGAGRADAEGDVAGVRGTARPAREGRGRR